MARLNYTQGELHSNGEQKQVTGNKNTQHLYDVFDKGGEYVSEDGNEQIVLSKNSNAFLVLNIDKAAQTIGEKPQCNNYYDCPPTETPEGGD